MPRSPESHGTRHRHHSPDRRRRDYHSPSPSRNMSSGQRQVKPKVYDRDTKRIIFKRVKRERKIWKKIKERRKLQKAKKRIFETCENQAMCCATEEELKRILETSEFLYDIPYDCIPQELKGEIAMAQGHATTIYVERDGLSTLTVVLPQENPTIANLKRGIESTARIQLQREQIQRFEDRLRRRNEQQQTQDSSETDNDTIVCYGIKSELPSEDERRQQVSVTTTPTTKSRTHKEQQQAPFGVNMRSTGELVYSETVSGQQHRANVSWRFLWRAYALYDLETKTPINDENGRKLLSEFGIENASKLKFCNREKYFGKKRQR